jgi:hypothetical protein
MPEAERLMDELEACFVLGNLSLARQERQEANTTKDISYSIRRAMQLVEGINDKQGKRRCGLVG